MPSGGDTPANLPLPPRAPPPPPPPPLSRRRSGERRLGGDSERSRRVSRRESEGERERDREGLCLRRAGSGEDDEDLLSRFSRPKRSSSRPRPMLSEAGKSTRRAWGDNSRLAAVQAHGRRFRTARAVGARTPISTLARASALMFVRVGSAVATMCLIAGTDALVSLGAKADTASALRRPSSRCSSTAHAMRHAGVRLQLFPGDDPWDFVRQNAREKAAEHMAMEEAERGEPLSHAFKTAYADALVELEVKDAMAGKATAAGSQCPSSRPPVRFLPLQKSAIHCSGGPPTCSGLPLGPKRGAAPLGCCCRPPKVATLTAF